MEVRNSTLISVMIRMLCFGVCVVSAHAQLNITAAAADSMIRNTKNIVILDVRTPEEFQLAHLPSARMFDFYDNNFIDSLRSLPKDATILVYSRTGTRSTEALAILSNLKYSRVYNMLGGIAAWKKERRPTIKGK